MTYSLRSERRRDVLICTLFLCTLFINTIQDAPSKVEGMVDEERFAPVDWCGYVASTPEPSILFYNRLQKTGSETMETIVRSAVADPLVNSVYVLLNKEEFGSTDFVARWDRLEALRALLNSRSMGGKYSMMVAAGHLSWFPFNVSDIKGATHGIEYMQTFRQCNARVVSHFRYNLDGSKERAKEKRENPREYQIFLKWFLGVSHSDSEACLRDRDCIRRSRGFLRSSYGNDMPMITHYMGGMFCESAQLHNKTIYDEYCGRYTTKIQPSSSGISHDVQYTFELAKGRILDFKRGFLSFGVLDHYADYIEMLECLYPTVFSGKAEEVRKGMHSSNIHSKADEDPQYLDALSDAANTICDNELRTDQELYNLAEKVFLQRYEYMKANKSQCCREKRLM